MLWNKANAAFKRKVSSSLCLFFQMIWPKPKNIFIILCATCEEISVCRMKCRKIRWWQISHGKLLLCHSRQKINCSYYHCTSRLPSYIYIFSQTTNTTRYQLSREVGKGHLLLIALESASKKVEGEEREIMGLLISSWWVWPN